VKKSVHKNRVTSRSISSESRRSRLVKISFFRTLSSLVNLFLTLVGFLKYVEKQSKKRWKEKSSTLLATEGLGHPQCHLEYQVNKE
jgi:hypothetical protein